MTFGDTPSCLGASAGTSAGLLCGAMSPEASVLLSSCSLDSEVTTWQDESGPTLWLREESERQEEVRRGKGDVGGREEGLIESRG